MNYLRESLYLLRDIWNHCCWSTSGSPAFSLPSTPLFLQPFCDPSYESMYLVAPQSSLIYSLLSIKITLSKAGYMRLIFVKMFSNVLGCKNSGHPSRTTCRGAETCTRSYISCTPSFQMPCSLSEYIPFVKHHLQMCVKQNV